ncbi:alpha-D-ribose 1-methylphosphonate 5-triphosphate diphosphatase [Rhodobacteraceae bacterium HSP-20]|uniref:Alpha-D-ribose 1-methylphosphonate 5-triphosphate diphosphatase n=1 Tax=Paragemmobacter amnigenus TaxID=2852097 RepID=A0ABS6J8J1_9RHOB|nr:alpha-D-ribose 1-methylphosphonate 5-triphosphate diphosphatase [Rhodobacter amnigenus]MBU9700061.1 alpha-D-ribose 1-methylphosphonate 5-triphosphate diphosphatase [Rhodobacter amnigenus]MBV4391288.1 alpha-D-ribose 1-methylphosphonate 5-triphosphate diphosphatase [Rhodobacter amnigenus]
MTAFLTPLRLVGAMVLTDDRFDSRAVGVVSGQITDGQGLPEVDLTGFWVMPGIVDLHGDGFERQVLPRPSAPFPLGPALAATDREAASHGVTTCYLAQSWSWEGGMRGPERAEALMAAVLDHRARALTDLRVQLRAETHLVDEVPRLIAAVERFRVDYVVFNDHLEEGFQMRRANPDGFAHWARKAGLTEAELAARMETAREQARAVPRALCALAEAFDRLGVTYGSHDDPDAETREVYRMIGARVAEFPTRFRAAAAAKAGGDPVLMGAPNVVRGGSQAGNVAAVELIRQGLCDGLVSDYHLPALPLAVWKLVDDGILPLERAWALVSSGPARVLGMVDRGRLDVGLRADLVVVDQETREIAATIAGGRLSHLSGRAAARFLSVRDGMRMAAE